MTVFEEFAPVFNCTSKELEEFAFNFFSAENYLKAETIFKDFIKNHKSDKLLLSELLNKIDEEEKCFSCPYYNPEAPDCCTYSPDDCYYNEYNDF